MRYILLFLIISNTLLGCDIISNAATPQTKTLTGSILFQNQSSNPYYVILDGNSIFSNGMAGKTQFTKFNIPIGDHIIKVLQISGYLFNPTEKTYIVKVFQGQTVSITFP
jgi:hypothetical protein